MLSIQEVREVDFDGSLGSLMAIFIEDHDQLIEDLIDEFQEYVFDSDLNVCLEKEKFARVFYREVTEEEVDSGDFYPNQYIFSSKNAEGFTAITMVNVD